MSIRPIDAGIHDGVAAPAKGSETSPAAAPLVQLTPNAGLLFCDAELPLTLIDTFQRRYFEEADPENGAGGYLLQEVVTEDGAFYHPIHNTLLDPDRTYLVSGRAALAAFLDRWVPLPYLRVLKREHLGQVALDDGPSNWARVFISAEPGRGADGAVRYRLCIAFDTGIDRAPREMDRPYPAPSVDDVRHGSAFVCATESDQLAWFLSEPWIGSWLEEEHGRSARGNGAPGLAAGSRLAHIAHYLTLLSLLAAARVLPRVRFFDVGKEGARNAVAVDLIVDLGAHRTCAMLVEAGGPSFAADLATSRFLTLRDLDRPTRCHTGPFASAVELARVDFGSERFSRQSGRALAFQWASLVRIGPEAERLAARSQAREGVTGLTHPRQHLRDTAPSPTMWRIAEADRETGDGAMIASPLLALLTEGGELRSQATHAVPPALRPHFSKASFLTFQLAELLLQALANINAPARCGERPGLDGPRRLRRLVLTTPLTLPSPDRRALSARAQAAIALVWEAMGWTDARPAALPPPSVQLGVDETLSTQAVYLYDSIVHRFQGTPADYFAAVGKVRTDHGIHPSLRVAGIDIGGSTSSLTVVTYSGVGDGTISPVLTLAESSPVGGEQLLEALVTRHLLPAIEADLGRRGIDEAGPVLLRIISGPDSDSNPAAQRHRQQFLLRLAMPLALALLRDYEGLTHANDGDEHLVTIGRLMDRSTGLNRSIADRLDREAQAAGAGGFSLERVPVVVNRRAMAQSIRTTLAPTLSAASRIVRALDADLLLISGWPARLREVTAELLEELPLRPDRIVALHEQRLGSWYPFCSPAGRIEDAKSAAVVGVLLSGRADGQVRLAIDGLALERETHYLAALSDQRATLDPARRLTTGGGRGEPTRASDQLGAPADAIEAQPPEHRKESGATTHTQPFESGVGDRVRTR